MCALFLQPGEKMKRITIQFFERALFIRLPPHPQTQRQGGCVACVITVPG